ncbi:LacI family DNA-binding transcriptional regulator [Pseudonocardia sp. GCM10023141]|uniref:LacI family DNA-binding transcriptional regulator n=1 Tax=Pseudonocardia sp. GCM10023141 TaxID=3252653 RepID=UPI00361CC27A
MATRTTLLDVARAAGVSKSTASRVLSGVDRNVDAELAERVLQAGERLGYRVNAVARALRRQTTGSFGVLVPSIRNPYFVHLVDAFSQVASRSGMGVILADSLDDPDVEAERLEMLRDSFVDGIVVVPTSMTRSGPAIRQAAERTRVVQVDRWATGAGCGFVGVDNAAGVAALVAHLRAAGRTRIRYVGAEQEASASAERLAAFRELAGPGDAEMLLPHFSTTAGRDAAHVLLAAPELPDAVLCAADVLAVGLLSTLQRRGVRVPRDVAVTAFDGTDLLELVDPPITALHHRLDAIAARAVDMLTGPASTEETRIRAELVVRAST